MNQYLTPEQRAAFERQLAQPLSEEEKQAAFRQGADMARADAAQADGTGDAGLEGSGFDSVEALLAAYEDSQSALNEAEEALARARAMIRALETDRVLAPQTPEERSGLVRRAWTRRAGAMRDLEALLPEVAAYILDHPACAMEEEGLERAYDAVRSGKYKSPAELLEDPESVKALAADPQVRDAVLTAHLAAVYRAGKDVPAFIGGGGSIAAPEQAKDGMKQAKAKLEALLKKD